MSRSSQLLILLSLCGQLCSAQILDDSTKQIYGPQTTDFLFEQNFVNGDTNYYHPDTLIHDFHYFTKIAQKGWFQQDLGNEGTASKPYYFTPYDNIYTETGLNAFSFYAPELDEIKYYRTRSPFTNMAYTQNTRGLGKLGFTHSQNISSNWNFALDVNRITASKQYSATSSEDRLIDHWDYVFNSNYVSKNRKYIVLADWIHFNHKQIEQGGIRSSSSLSVEPEDLLADYNTNYQELYSGVHTRERWNDLHIYQQYKLASGFQVFHILDWQKHKSFFTDNTFNTNALSGLYGSIDSLEARDTLRTFYRFENIQNKFGFKGEFKGFSYLLGLRQRLYTFNALHNLDVKSGLKSETIAELDASYSLKDQLGSLNVFAGFSSNASYTLNAKLKFKIFEAGFTQLLKPPSLIFENYDSGIQSWANNGFKKTFVNHFEGKLILERNKLFLIPAFSIDILDNYLYFNQEILPKQSQGAFSLLKFDISAGLSWKNLSIKNQLVLSSSSNKAIFRLPGISNNTNIEYRLLYAKKLNLNFGTDIYFRSSYLADAWSPLLQSFYLQDSSQVWGYPVANAYIKFMLKRVKLAFGFNYLNQGLPTNGFYVTPDYLSVRRTFYLKVNWPLFD